jgi:hypothetical protein
VTFSDACALVLPTGQHKGRTIADVGITGDGLAYLDWLRQRPSTADELEHALEIYFANDAIAAELNELLGRGDSQ